MTTANAIGSQYPFATADIANGAVTYAKIQNVASVSLLGNPTGSPADASAITLGAGLSFSGTTLIATGALPYATVSGTSQAAAANNGYVTNNAALCTVTLPATAAVGDIVEVQGLGAGGWALAQNSGQIVHCPNGVATTSGAGGSLASTAQYDFIRVRCIVTNTTWSLQAVTNNVTVV